MVVREDSVSAERKAAGADTAHFPEVGAAWNVQAYGLFAGGNGNAQNLVSEHVKDFEGFGDV